MGQNSLIASQVQVPMNDSHGIHVIDTGFVRPRLDAAYLVVEKGRGAFIDQSASLNLFMESPNIGALSSMYMHAWKQGIKTCYYLRSRPATKIAKTTVSDYSPAQAVACSLENPEACEACQ